MKHITDDSKLSNHAGQLFLLAVTLLSMAVYARASAASAASQETPQNMFV